MHRDRLAAGTKGSPRDGCLYRQARRVEFSGRGSAEHPGHRMQPASSWRGSGVLPTELQSSAAKQTRSVRRGWLRVKVRKGRGLAWVKPMTAHRARRRATMVGRIA
jgi:hypothetical protein